MFGLCYTFSTGFWGQNDCNTKLAQGLVLCFHHFVAQKPVLSV